MTSGLEIAKLVASRTGIEITRGGVDRSFGELVGRRARALGLSTEKYRSLLEANGNGELQKLIDDLTVGYTWFFRDLGQLAAVEALLAEVDGRRALRIWVPGCSTGEDAFSLALIAERLQREVEILGTDLNSRSIEQARRGTFGAWSIRELDARSLGRFARTRDGSFRLDGSVRERVRFALHNLLDEPPVPEGGTLWDVILCRNVLIYFSHGVAAKVVRRLGAAVAPRGHLLLGASEVVFDIPHGLEAVYVAGRLVFRRVSVARPSSRPERASEPRDWLMAKAQESQGTRFVSAFPEGAAGISNALCEPPEPAPGKANPLELGHALLDRGDTSGARDIYRGVVERDSLDAEAHMYVGVASYLSGDVDAAASALRAALFLNGELWPAAFYLGLCHENGGHPEEAVRAYREVIRLLETLQTSKPRFASPFDAWRGDLYELARLRVARAALDRPRVAL